MILPLHLDVVGEGDGGNNRLDIGVTILHYWTDIRCVSTSTVNGLYTVAREKVGVR